MERKRRSGHGGKSAAAAAGASVVHELGWSALIPEAQWRIFHAAAGAVRRAAVDFVLGGALGLAYYTGRLRNTKDADFFILAADRERAIEALRGAGFADYYDYLAYDRKWIFRGVLEDIIVDLIWTTPNELSPVTEVWFEHSHRVTLRGEPFRIIPVEELMLLKSFVLQRGRTDWPDLINILRISGERVNWRRLLHIMGPHLDLLHALLMVFAWVSPESAARLPPPIRRKFRLQPWREGDLAALERQRVALLDSRPWYAAFQPETVLMEV